MTSASQTMSTSSSSLAAMLDSDIAFTLLPLLGLKDSLRSYAPLLKGCAQRCLDYMIIHKRDVVGGKLPLPSLKKLNGVVADLRIGLDVIQDDDIAWRAKDGVFLRGRELYFTFKQATNEDVIRIETEIFTNWDSAYATPGYGIFHQLYNWYRTMHTPDIKKWEVDLMQDVQYWNSSRVCDTFIILFARPDGTIMVPEDCNRVYLVCGQNKAIGEAMRKIYKDKHWVNVDTPPYPDHIMFHGPIAGILLSTTIMPWEGKIAMGFGFTEIMGKAPPFVLNKALEAYVAAVNSNTLISVLPKKEGTSLKSVQYRQKSLNYATPSMTTAELDKYLPLKEKVREYLDVMRYCDRTYHALMSPEGDINMADLARVVVLPSFTFTSIWITRFDRSSPERAVFFTSTPSYKPYKNDIDKLLGVVSTEQAEPSLSEYLLCIKKVCEDTGRKPERVVIDCSNLEILQLLAHWLQEVGIKIAFTQLQSKEEYKFKLFHKLRCPVCKAGFCLDGTRLLRCGGCKDKYYCSKEHQKKD